MVPLAQIRVMLATAAIATVAVGVTGSSGATRETRARGLAGRPRTIAVLPYPIFSPVADGRRLAWWIESGKGETREYKIQIFDRATRRLTTIRPNLRFGLAEPPSILGTALAGTRILWAVTGERDARTLDAFVYTATVADRRPRKLAYHWVEKELGGDLFGDPARIAGGGGRLAFLTFDDVWRWDAWRVAGAKALRVPYEPKPLVGFAVEGRRLATANWVGRLGRDWQPAFSPDGREIAWNHDGTIWLMNADGSAQHALAGAAPAEAGSGPRWSPDGKTLAFESEGAIFLVGRDGSNPHRLVAGGEPAWSPDGTTLALLRSNGVWVVVADGSNARRLTNNAACDGDGDSRPDWSPDGRSLVFACGNAEGSHVHLVDLASGAQRDLTPAGPSAWQPAWSPDGARIAFGRFELARGYGSSLYTIRPDGSGLTKLTQTPGEEYVDDGEPAWSPDGRRLAYSRDISGGEGYYELWIVNADGSGQQKLKSANRNAVTPQWSPDGRTIVVGDDDRHPYLQASGVYALDPAGGKSRLLATSTNPPTVELRDILSGKLLRQWRLPGVSSVWLSERFLVAKVGKQCLRYDLTTGSKRGIGLCRTWVGLSLSGSRGVYRVGRRLYLLDLRSGRRSRLVRTGAAPVGPVIEGKGVVWAEAYRKGSRVRELVLR